MKKIYYLSSCDTCRTLMQTAGISEKSGFELQDIKTQKITPAQLSSMKKLAESYEKLFSRRAIKYKELGLKNQTLSENDYENFILNEYTFLKRPVVIIDNHIFIGSDKKNLEELTDFMKRLSGK